MLQYLKMNKCLHRAARRGCFVGEIMKPYAEKFYNSPAWISTRAAYMISRGMLCERCSTDDEPVLAKVVHHKVYLTEDNIHNTSVTLSWDNLEALCQDCHNREHHAAKQAARYIFDSDGNVIPLESRAGRH